MEADQFRELLKRYEENTLSPQEKLWLEKWYTDYESDEFNGFSSSEHSDQVKTDMKTVIFTQLQEEKPALPLWTRIHTYAAILILFIPALLLLVHQYRNTFIQQEKDQFTTFTTTAGESKILTLQDHSIVHLNPSSRLKVSSRFGSLARRDVFLEKGNAFFEVAKDRRHPFFVHAQFLTTRVLGTKFKVSNTLDRTTEISVSEGKVQVSKSRKVLDLLTAGKKLVYQHNSGSWQKTDFGISENNLWYKPVANLNQASFEEVAHTVKIYYGVVLKSTNPYTLSYRYNLQIRAERTLDQTIKMICSVHRNKHRRSADGIVIY